MADKILDPDLDFNNLKIEGADHQGSRRMVVVDPMRNLAKFSGEKTESTDNHLDAFGDYLEIQQINVADANVVQIITQIWLFIIW